MKHELQKANRVPLVRSVLRAVLSRGCGAMAGAPKVWVRKEGRDEVFL